MDFVVPTGNFGNILAAWYARAMGLPVGRLICASNRNRVLTDFFNAGIYDTGRRFHKTISPSMDIIISSNLERLLYEVSGRDPAQVSVFMRQLKEEGRYHVGNAMKTALRMVFEAESANDSETRECIRTVHEKYGYLLDPHTAVAWRVYDHVKGANKAVIVSTASPYKFAGDVLTALTGDEAPRSGGREDVEELFRRTGVQPPTPISDLWALPERHGRLCEVAGMRGALLAALGP